jgi:hypothetical protein
MSILMSVLLLLLLLLLLLTDHVQLPVLLPG